jgi:CheY-like chemotaxis protein
MSSILLVSPDRDLRTVATRALRHTGWRVTAVSHGGHAVLACASGQAFDVLIVEDRMIDGTGAGLARRLRRYCPGMQMVRMHDGQLHGDSEGITVVRPMTADDLIEAVLHASTAIGCA